MLMISMFKVEILNFLKIPIRIKVSPADCKMSFAKKDNKEYFNGTPAEYLKENTLC